MKIGVVGNCFLDRTWEEACRISKEAGLQAIEVCAGGFDNKVHCNPEELLKDSDKLKKFRDIAQKNGLEINALSAHANPLHPQKSFADNHIADLEAAVELAGKIGINTICGFAGLPGAGEDALYPNWITYSWPDYFSTSVVEWQWKEKIVPFWKSMVKKARKVGVRFAFELHPGDSVYNTETFLKLRDEVGAEEIGCTIDPGHFPFQGIDPIICIKSVKGSIYNFHAKDGKIDKQKADFTGLLDWKDMEKDFEKRSWNYRNVGYGEGVGFWADIIYTLKMIGYDGVLGIEHEDPMIEVEEGLRKANEFLSGIIFRSKKLQGD